MMREESVSTFKRQFGKYFRVFIYFLKLCVRSNIATKKLILMCSLKFYTLLLYEYKKEEFNLSARTV